MEMKLQWSIPLVQKHKPGERTVNMKIIGRLLCNYARQYSATPSYLRVPNPKIIKRPFFIIKRQNIFFTLFKDLLLTSLGSFFVFSLYTSFRGTVSPILNTFLTELLITE